MTSCWLGALMLPLLSLAQIRKQTNGTDEIPFFKKTGSITLHLNNYMFSGRKVATPPFNLIAEITAAKNFTVGPMFTYFQFRRSEFEAINATRWVNPEIRYHELMAGVKAEYHLNAVIEKIIQRKIPHHFIDTYTAGWMGYSFVKTNAANADEALIAENKGIRGGIGIGARSLVLPWLGFSLEGGCSSYGYCSFGLFFMAR
ncbi:MAG TPA: hypothetical protein VNJ07_03420 [Chitinophagales bacterium]|nr:hypothetical protein [Chitinophagales bacterium]